MSLLPKYRLILLESLKENPHLCLEKHFLEQIKPKLLGNHFWSPSYCVVSVGAAPIDVIKQFIENQRKLHSEKQINQSKKYRLKGDGLIDPPDCTQTEQVLMQQLELTYQR